MAPRTIERIRDTIRLVAYDMTVHAAEEMTADDLDIIDVEEAVLNGQVVRKEVDDPRGTRYVIEGVAATARLKWASWDGFRATNVI